MHLSEIKIKNFRQIGSGKPVFSVQFHEGVTALVGKNDAGKTAVIDAMWHVLLTRDMEFMRQQIEDFHIHADVQQAAVRPQIIPTLLLQAALNSRHKSLC